MGRIISLPTSHQVSHFAWNKAIQLSRENFVYTPETQVSVTFVKESSPISSNILKEQRGSTTTTLISPNAATGNNCRVTSCQVVHTTLHLTTRLLVSSSTNDDDNKTSQEIHETKRKLEGPSKN
jgi:hypothetical protein